MQPIRTILLIFVGDHPGITPAVFGQIPISGSREEVVRSFPYIIQCKIVTSRRCYIPNMNALGLVVLDKNIFENCVLRSIF